jgi:hypothetical protein
VSYNGAPAHVDLGAVQANYTLSFMIQPADTAANTALLPPPTVQVYESGVAFGGTGGTLTLAASAGTPSITSVATTANGLVSLAPTFSAPETDDTLIVSIAGASTVASATSAPFNITATTPIFGTMSFSPTSTAPAGTNQIITISDTVTYTGGQPTGAVTFVLNGMSYTAACTPAGGTESCTYAVPAATIAALPAGTYSVTASLAADSNYNSATGSSGSFIVQTTPVITWTPTSSTGYAGTAIGAGVLDASTSTTTGTFAYTATNSSNTTVSITSTSTLPLGAYTLTATFTPSTSSFAPATATISFTVVNQSIFVVNAGGSVSSLYDGGTSQSSDVSGGGIGLAVDKLGYVWSINSSGNGLSVFTDAGALASTYTPTGLTGGSALAIDGNSNLWVANGNGVISQISNAGATVSTTAGSTTAAPSGIAIDSSGNVWVANPTANTVDEIIGGAVPSAPLSNAVQTATPGVAP